MKEKYLFPEALFISVDADIITTTADDFAPDRGDGGEI